LRLRGAQRQRIEHSTLPTAAVRSAHASMALRAGTDSLSYGDGPAESNPPWL
jgi:hypothetical protein